MSSGSQDQAADPAMETVRLSWHNAYQRLQNYLTPDQAEALLTSARARGYVIAAGLRVTAAPERRYEPDEFEVGPAPAATARVTRDGADQDLAAADLLPGDVLRCGASTNYVLIVKTGRDGDDIMVTVAGGLASEETRCRIPAAKRVQVSRRGCFDGPMTAAERFEALHGWYVATSGYCIGRDAYWPHDLDKAWRAARDEAEAALKRAGRED